MRKISIIAAALLLSSCDGLYSGGVGSRAIFDCVDYRDGEQFSFLEKDLAVPFSFRKRPFEAFTTKRYAVQVTDINGARRILRSEEGAFVKCRERPPLDLRRIK